MRNTALLGFLTLIVSLNAAGWGDLGHGVVGEIAFRLLDPNTRTKVTALLKNPDGMTLAEAATWPDLMRSNENFKNTAIDTWHYATQSDQTKKLIETDNIVTAINLMDKILSTGESYTVPKKNPATPTQSVVIDRSMAIKFLAHFVGDIHQPLHVGNELDRGANLCLIKWFGQVRREEGFWNLHALWDEGLLSSMTMGLGDLTNLVMARLTPEKTKELSAETDPTQWALETAALRPGVYPQLDPQKPVEETKQPYCNNPSYANLPRPNGPSIDKAALDALEAKLLNDPQIPRLSYDYRYAQLELIKQQLLKAGVRLADRITKGLSKLP